MDRRYFNYSGVAPQTAPAIYSDVDGYVVDYDSLNHAGQLHNGGVPYFHNPTIYEPSPAGYTQNVYQSNVHYPQVYANNYLTHDPQYNYDLPTHYQRALNLEGSKHRAYHVEQTRGICDRSYMENGFGGSSVQRECFHNDGKTEFSPHLSSRSNMVNGYVNPGYSMFGVSDGLGMSPVPNYQLQNHLSVINVRPPDEVPSRQNQDGCPNINGRGTPAMHSLCYSGDRERQSREHNSYKASRDSKPNSSMDPTIRGPRRSNRLKQKGQAQHISPSYLSKNFEPPVKRSGIQKASSPKNFAPSTKRGNQRTSAPLLLREEKKKKLCADQTKLPAELVTEPDYHITWEGDDEESECLEQNCSLCNKDLSYISSGEEDVDYYDDLEPPKLPEVAVLQCGHAFHSVCLQLYMPEEESRDPPCSLCMNCSN